MPNSKGTKSVYTDKISRSGRSGVSVSRWSHKPAILFDFISISKIMICQKKEKKKKSSNAMVCNSDGI